jgi:hypothetical protein
MNTKILNMIRGAGSLVDIAATDGMKDAIARRRIKRGVSSHFFRVSLAINRACSKFENDIEACHNKK